MKYQTTLNDNRQQCLICPRECKLKDNQCGFCFVREDINGEIKLKTYGYNTGLAIDPIEKKPLYHFYPMSKVLSFGTNGCIMGCQFCQNDNITKVKPNYNFLNETSPEMLVNIALDYNCKGIAFTYNDPIAFFEYTIDTAKLCKVNGLKTVAVTSGYINPEPAKEFFEYIDAVNIDLKGFSEDFYKKNCLAHLEPVLDTIKYVKQNTNCHLELTTLLIEQENDFDYMESTCYLIKLKQKNNNEKYKNIEVEFDDKKKIFKITGLEGGKEYYMNIIAKNSNTGEFITYKPVKIVPSLTTRRLKFFSLVV